MNTRAGTGFLDGIIESFVHVIISSRTRSQIGHREPRLFLSVSNFLCQLRQVLGSFPINMEAGLELPKPDGVRLDPPLEAWPAQPRCKWVAAFPNRAMPKEEAAGADFPPLTLLWEDASGTCLAAVRRPYSLGAAVPAGLPCCDTLPYLGSLRHLGACDALPHLGGLRYCGDLRHLGGCVVSGAVSPCGLTVL